MAAVLGLPLLTCLALVAILAYLGLHVLQREIIFIDIALAQLAAVGAIAAHLALHVHQGAPASYLASFLFVLAAAAFYAVVRGRVGHVPVEAVIGVSYAIAAAGALFLLGVGTGGHVHVQSMLAGSILWAKPRDVVLCAVTFAAVGALFRVFRGPLTAISADYEGAARAGANVVLWDFVFYALCGAVITVAVRVGGVVVVFAFLIMPATVSAVVSRRWRVRLVVSWAAGAAASVLGLLLAYRLDFSVGPSVAGFLGLELVLVGAYALRRSRLTATVAGGVLVAAFVLLVLAKGGSAPAAPQPSALEQRAEKPVGAAVEAPRAGAAVKNFGQQVSGAAGVHELEALLRKAPDELSRHDVVLRALDVDIRAGARLAVEFLRADPPLFFRQEVVERLERAAGKPLGFDVTTAFRSAANQRAADTLTKALGLERSAEPR